MHREYEVFRKQTDPADRVAEEGVGLSFPEVVVPFVIGVFVMTEVGINRREFTEVGDNN